MSEKKKNLEIIIKSLTPLDNLFILFIFILILTILSFIITCRLSHLIIMKQRDLLDT